MLEVALEALRPVVGPVAVGDRAAGASGAEVHHVRLPDGRPAVLKVSPGTSSQHGTDHRREMVFYQQMADRVEVATPAVLALVDSPDASALLLSSHEPRPPADEWTEGEWISLAADLAALHDSTPPRVGPVGEPLWLGSALGDPPVDFVRGYWSTTAAAPYLDGMLAACAGFARVLAGDHCFVHGDCHVANLLGHEDRLVWVDWQACGWAHPAEDLALLRLRAGWDHAEVPHAGMLAEYEQRRRGRVDDLDRAVDAAEMGLLLLATPHFAADRSRADRLWATHRLLHLWLKSHS